MLRHACSRAWQQQRLRRARALCTATVVTDDVQPILRRVEHWQVMHACPPPAAAHTLLTRMSSLQDRIAKDGSLVSGSLTAAASAAVPQEGSRPAYLPPTAPTMPPISEDQLQGLVDLVTGSR